MKQLIGIKSVKDVNEAYETFLSITAALYENNCPLVKKVGKLWLTKKTQARRKNQYIKNF